MSTPGMGDKAEGDQGLKSCPGMGPLYITILVLRQGLEALNHSLLATRDFFWSKKSSQHIGYVVKVITLTMSHTVDTLCINIENDDIHNYANNLILDDMIPIK